MREFSGFEKNIIKKMIKKGLNDQNVLDLISDIIITEKRAIQLDFKTETLNIFHTQDDVSILTELIEMIFLIKYLEKEYLIFIHSNYQSPNPSGNFLTKPNGINQNNLSQYQRSAISTTIFDEIDRYKQSYFSCSTELIKHKKNEFKTDEQIRHVEDLELAKKSLEKSDIGVSQAKKSIKRATTAIIISFILGLISIGTSFYIANKQLNSETKINIKQFEKLNSQFDSLKNGVTLIDSRLQDIIIPDTINAVIIKKKK